MSVQLGARTSLPGVIAQEYETAERQWAQLLDDHLLPAAGDETFWRFSRTHDSSADADQGWKIHVSATVRSAPEMISRVAPVLERQQVLWKAPASLQGLQTLNSGLLHGYSQIGKIVTAYPRSAELARSLAQELDEATAHLPGPRVPFDRQFRDGSVVHYRYGVHNPVEQISLDGVTFAAMRDPQGNLVADRREPGSAVPSWVQDTIGADGHRGTPAGPLASRYLSFEALMQRGKGGTYLALDLASTPVRRCVLREGRRHGETELDGRDGRDRVAHERDVLAELSARSVYVPRVIDSFVVGGHQYLVLEHLDGPHLQEWLVQPGKRSPAEIVGVAAGVAAIIAQLHAAGWAWRDCKATNIVVAAGEPYAIDLEGACRIDEPDRWPWGSPGHVPPEWPGTVAPVEQDLYALGVVLAALVGTSPPGSEAPRPSFPLIAHEPAHRAVTALLAADRSSRPSAASVQQTLLDTLAFLGRSGPEGSRNRGLADI